MRQIRLVYFTVISIAVVSTCTTNQTPSSISRFLRSEIVQHIVIRNARLLDGNNTVRFCRDRRRHRHILHRLGDRRRTDVVYDTRERVGLEGLQLIVGDLSRETLRKSTSDNALR